METYQITLNTSTLSGRVLIKYLRSLPDVKVAKMKVASSTSKKEVILKEMEAAAREAKEMSSKEHKTYTAEELVKSLL